MNMSRLRLIPFLLLMTVVAFACVPKKKLAAEVNAKRAAEEKSKRLDRDLDAPRSSS
jgi:hypothetical protein